MSMKLVLMFACLSAVSGSISGQYPATPGHPRDTIQEEEEVVGVIGPEMPPSFPGGIDSLHAFVQRNLTSPHANPGRPAGKVFVEFFIEKDGSLSAIRVAKGLGDPYDNCVLDVFHIMPKWKPATHRDGP